MMILDIGCGRKKIPGAIGIDFSPLSDADVSLDLNRDRLPFNDSSVDFVYSSHTLEHLSVEGFFHTIAEVYRVLKPDAQFNLLVPYFTDTLSLANPFHNNGLCFNEHTFRFFSSEKECAAIPAESYQTPSCPQWGLRYSANAEIAVEFRTISVERFFFPAYRDKSAADRDLAGKRYLNVTEQIDYSLQAIKPCPSRPETGPIAAAEDPYATVERQLAYLTSQFRFFKERPAVAPPGDLVERAIKLSRSRRLGELFVTDSVMKPVTLLVFELDYVIQALQRRIDASHGG